MNSINKSKLRDNGGRRSGIDRRCFSYSGHIPERRKNPERRCSEDRRSGYDRRDDYNNTQSVIEMRVASMDRRISWNMAAV